MLDYYVFEFFGKYFVWMVLLGILKSEMVLLGISNFLVSILYGWCCWKS
jgi:hypothetical protein